MAAPKYTDRVLAQQVRTLTLQRIKALLEMPRVDMENRDRDLYEAVLIKLSGTVLPRLNEVTGEDGQPITIQLAKEVAEKTKLYATTPDPSGDSTGQPSV